jgi:peptidoglycan/xylan/chitin deacetylase (PgdA/CDA1 family)
MTLTIVSYHYVRDLARSKYPTIKGLDAALFAEQLLYIKQFYTPVTMEQVFAAVQHHTPLPPNAILLTFDDGYIDHFEVVFPLLRKLGMQGTFFIPVVSVVDHVMLDVNKIHFILASTEIEQLLDRLYELLAEHQAQYSLPSVAEYKQRVMADKFDAVASRFDTAEVTFVKRLLQRELPDELRKIIMNQLFAEFVSADEAAFARSLYVNPEQIRQMHTAGMHIGSHSTTHCWLNRLTADAQKAEIEHSLTFLRSLGVNTTNWAISYPYGAYDDALLALLKTYGCTVGVTTQTALADLQHPLTLARLDTNDLPKDRAAQPVDWTIKARH